MKLIRLVIIIYVLHDWKACSVSAIFASKMLAMQTNKILLEILFHLFLEISDPFSIVILEFCPAT